MKNFLTGVWVWLDGKKSVIGGAIVIACDAQPFIPHAAVLTPVVPYVKAIGYSMFGVGAACKIYKAGQAATPVVALLPESHVKQIVAEAIASLPAPVDAPTASPYRTTPPA